MINFASCKGLLPEGTKPLPFLAFTIYGVGRVQLAHFGLGDWKDISIADVIIIIKTEISISPIVIIFSVVVCLICLLQHILSLLAYIIRENRDFVFIIIMQCIMSWNSRIRFGLQTIFICLYVTTSLYSHCANSSPCQGLCAPHAAPLPPLTRTKSNKGWTGSPLEPSEGAL